MNFTAIDFETATYHRHSACAVGIVTVEHGIITDEYYTLIQPPDNFYSYHNIRMHGITSKHTANVGTFDELYPEIYIRLLNKTVVAHRISAQQTQRLLQAFKYTVTTPRSTFRCTRMCTIVFELFTASRYRTTCFVVVQFYLYKKSHGNHHHC